MAFQPPAPYSPTNFLDEVQKNALPPVQSTEKLYPAPASISGQRFNQAFPYQLIVVERSPDGTYTPKSASNGGNWTFSLPIPPEALSITMPFAITTSVTLGGFIEEHGGAPIRMITLSGSTGVLFGRDAAPVPPSLPGVSIFAGTIAAASATAAASSIIGQATPFVTNAVADSEFASGGDMENLTGYFQMRLLQLFLEAYAEMKKTKAGRTARLAFATWKEESVWLVAPQQFEVSKNASSPFEYMYSLALKANKRIKISSGVADILQTYTPVQQDPAKLASLLQTVNQVRTVVQDASQTIAAVGGDVHNGLYEPMRELSLFAKDALSIPLMVADLPDTIIQNAKGAILDLMSVPGATARIFTNGASAVADAVADLLDLAAEQTDDPLSLSSRAAHPANDPFLSPSDNYPLFSGIQLGDLNLPPAVTAAVATERTRVRRLTGLDFQARRDSIDNTSVSFQNAIGLGSATYNEIYGINTPPPPVVSEPTDEDYDVVFALSQLVLETDRLVVNTNNDLNPKLDSIAAMAGLASRSGIAFTIPKSKFAVPFPYGSTIEMLAARYLNDPLRWHEIVALNGLQAPYVDEEGFHLELLINGADNTVMVQDAGHLFVGQPVWISSRGVTRTRRRITKINHLTPTQHLITVDGLPNLDQYTVLADATLQAFLPNTVNSQQVIYIPSDQEPKDDEDFRTKAIPGIDAYDPLLAVGGIDFLLTPANDLVVTPDGDNKWAVGLTNIVQKVRLALSTRRGTLMGHPQYGLPIGVGMSVADLSASDIVRAAQDLFAGDPTFTGVKAATVSITGPVARLGVSVQVAGTSQVIPIGLDVTR
jgi:hypothetical protein